MGSWTFQIELEEVNPRATREGTHKIWKSGNRKAEQEMRD